MAEPISTSSPPLGGETLTQVQTSENGAAAPVPSLSSLTPIAIRAPSKYQGTSKAIPASTTTSERFVPPSNRWLWRTWAVTHSTLSMWRNAQNVRITYSPQQPPSSNSDSAPAAEDSSASTINDNLVEYEKKGGKGGVKTVLGTEKPDPNVYGAWNWRGKGWLVIASSHWELLGWGERPCADAEDGIERWVVTWFAPTLFTEEGIDLYCDRKEGLSARTADDIIAALKKLDQAPKVVEKVEQKMREVAISLPWKEGKK